MRIAVTCELKREAVIPVNHQHLLSGVIYGLLACSDAEYSRFLHDEGYALDGSTKHFKLFAFGWLRPFRYRVYGNRMAMGPGRVVWQIASPRSEFLTHCATGLLATGELKLGTEALPIAGIETLPTPDFAVSSWEGKCLSPIVVSRARPEAEGGGTHYIRPEEGEAFSEAVRHNLIHKFETLHGRPPIEDNFALTFDPEYLARNRGGTKKITFKSIDMVGAYAPFKVIGSPDMLETMFDCGAGQGNSSGFGMVEFEKCERQ